MRSSILWRRLDLSGHEAADLAELSAGWKLTGVALFAHDERPCRLEYDIECDAAWRTQWVKIRGHVNGVPAALDLTRDARSGWSANGGLVPAVHGCVDVDLEFSPSTNLLPIRRLGLAVGSRASVRAAWVRFPGLTLEVLEQEYARTGDASYQYESSGGIFCRELTVNADGFVLDYPDFWRTEAASTRSGCLPAPPTA